MLVDASIAQVTTSAFTSPPPRHPPMPPTPFGPPPRFPRWVSSWEASLRPPHLGTNLLCVRARLPPGPHPPIAHDPAWPGPPPHGPGPHPHERYVRILRSFTAVDLIPPGAVPGLGVGHVTATGATVTWDAATDNYGLAGYAVAVDGGPSRRTTAGTRRWVVTGLSPSTSHTVSVVAIDLAGNTSAAATASFTTAAAPPPPTSDGDLTVTPQEGSAMAVWHPDLAQDARYRVFLDGEAYGELTVEQACQDAAGAAAAPCTAQDVIGFPVTPLEQETSYTLRVEAVRADGTTDRTLSATFTTGAGPEVVPAATAAEIASESSQCAGRGGTFYASPTARAHVTPPAGATQLFPGCYRAANSSCIDAFLPPSATKLLDCADDLTHLLLQLAPTGHGPVISSFEGVLDGTIAPPIPIPTQRPPLEPITWCVNGGCTTVLETAEEAAGTLAEVEAAGAVAAPLLVIGAKVFVALAVIEVLEIAFAEELGIAGLFEYPVHYDTNFDTFSDWGKSRGAYYDSLKLYAEVIKTTTLYADGSNLPFKWNERDDQQLKLSIDRACSAQRGSPTLSTPYGCRSDDGFAVYVPGARNYRLRDMAETGKHIVSAMNDAALTLAPLRVQWFGPAYSRGGQAARAKGYRRNWFDRPEFQRNECTSRAPGMVCDEFPFWSTSQAVDLSGIRASLKPVPPREAGPQGNDLSQFYRRCKVNDGDRFLVLPIEPWVDAGGPSFGFRVEKGGTSLCLIPSP